MANGPQLRAVAEVGSGKEETVADADELGKIPEVSID